MLAHDRYVATDAADAQADGSANADLLILHGFMGSKRNWMSVARRLAERRRDRAVVTIDLPLHGDSRPAEPPYTVAALAHAVLAFATQPPAANTPPRTHRAILGHSLGGKVALLTASAWPVANPVEQTSAPAVWLLDSTPAAVPERTSASDMLNRVRALPMPQPTRGDVARLLKQAGATHTEAEWMATNVVPQPDGVRWRFDLDALQQLLEDFYRADLWPAAEQLAAAGRLHVVHATRSSLLTPATLNHLTEIGARIHAIDADHWVNISNPEALLHLSIHM